MAGQEALEAKANGTAKESEASGPGTKVRRDCLPESRESEQVDRAMNPKRRGIWRPGDEASAQEDLGSRKPCDELFAPESREKSGACDEVPRQADGERRKPCEETFAPEDRGKYHRWRLPDGLTLLRAWTRDGLSEREIAAKCGVARSTFARWKQQFPEIAAALNYGPELANAEVESALHSLAVGYTKALRKTYKVKHVEYGENGRKLREYEELETGIDDVHVPPNMSAQKFWLENRAPETWGDEAGRGGPGECGQPVRILCDVPRGGIPQGRPEKGKRVEGAARTESGEERGRDDAFREPEAFGSVESGLSEPSMTEAEG